MSHGSRRPLLRGATVLSSLGLLLATAAGSGGDATTISSTYVRGSRADGVGAMAIGPDGALWIAARSGSIDLPGAQRSFQALQQGANVLVLRLDPATRQVLTAAWLGGSADEAPTGLAFDAAGRAYVSGTTTSWDFPATSWTHAPPFTDTNAFAARVSADGKRFDWVAVVGGTGYDEGTAITVAADGGPVMVGTSDALDFPAAASLGPAALNFAQNAFVTKFAADDGSVVWSSLLGGFDMDQAAAIAPLADGGVLVAGQTFSFDFPSSLHARSPFAFGASGFVVDVAPDGGALRRSRVYEGTRVQSLAVRGDTIVAAGFTEDDALPIARFRPRGELGFLEAFAVRLADDDLSFAAGTYFGGTSHEFDATVALAGDGTVWMAGTTYSPDLPLPQLAAVGSWTPPDAYAVALDAADFRVRGGLALTGSSEESNPRLAIDAGGRAWFAMTTGSDDLPLVNPLTMPADPTHDDILLAHVAAPHPGVRPGAPHDVRAVAAAARAVNVSWRAGSPPAASYVIERRTSSFVNHTQVVPGIQTEWTDYFATPDTGFTYTVVAVRDGAVSPISEEARVLTPATLDIDEIAGRVRSRPRSHRPSDTLDLAFRVTPAKGGGASGDVIGSGLRLVLYTRIGQIALVDVPAGDPRWKKRGSLRTWRSGWQRVEWRPATGEVEIRTLGVFVVDDGADTQSLRVLMGTDASTASVPWRRASPRELRTP